MQAPTLPISIKDMTLQDAKIFVGQMNSIHMQSYDVNDILAQLVNIDVVPLDGMYVELSAKALWRILYEANIKPENLRIAYMNRCNSKKRSYIG